MNYSFFIFKNGISKIFRKNTNRTKVMTLTIINGMNYSYELRCMATATRDTICNRDERKLQLQSQKP